MESVRLVPTKTIPKTLSYDKKNKNCKNLSCFCKPFKYLSATVFEISEMLNFIKYKVGVSKKKSCKINPNETSTSCWGHYRYLKLQIRNLLKLLKRRKILA